MAITPNGADIWRNAGNVACYLGKQWESITFVASASGQLSVLDGVFVPSQAVDTNGSQLHLGKLIHLPINNTSRAILSGVAPGAVGVWSAARQVTGSFGVPAGAKAVRVAFLLQPYSTAAGICFLDIVLSDNNTSTPTGAEAHPRCAIAQYASAAAQQPTVCVELDVPLNAAGQFYNWTITAVNVTLANSFMQIVAKGYYMGV